MHIVARGVHLKLTPGLRHYVDQHLVRPLARLNINPATGLDVQLCVSTAAKGGAGKECRVTLRMPHTRALHVAEHGYDLYRCIGDARDRIERLAKREMDKRRSPPEP
jgi:ribosomal subunit interface protein